MGRSERAKSVVSKEMLLAAAKEASRKQQELLDEYRRLYLKEKGMTQERIDSIVDGLSKSSKFEDNPNE